MLIEELIPLAQEVAPVLGGVLPAVLAVQDHRYQSWRLAARRGRIARAKHWLDEVARRFLRVPVHVAEADEIAQPLVAEDERQIGTTGGALAHGIGGAGSGRDLRRATMAE